MRHHEKERTLLLNTCQEDPNINELNSQLRPVAAQLYLDPGKKDSTDLDCQDGYGVHPPP